MKYRILIVEDNIMLAGQQKKRLEKSGYEAEIRKLARLWMDSGKIM